jgi:hypothetical protein
VTWFLVETFAPSAQALGAIDASIEASLVSVPGVTHLASLLIPEDETCFHIFDAADRDSVAGVSAAAGLTPLRIVETLFREHWG